MGFLKSASLVSLWTLASRVLGFGRDVALANKLGAGLAADVFFVVLLIPNLLRRLFAEGAVNAALIPLLNTLPEASHRPFIAALLGRLLVGLVVVTVLAEIFMPQVVSVLAPGFRNVPEQFDQTVHLARLTFPYLPLITLAALAGTLLNSKRQFAAYAAMPCLLNIALLLALLAAPSDSALFWASLAIPAGGVAQLGLMLWALRRQGLMFPVPVWHHGELATFWQKFAPAILAVGVLQISVMIDTIMASLVGGGAVSFLQYAARFYQLPLALIALSLATVLLPQFSTLAKQSDRAGTHRLFAQSLQVGWGLAIPATIGLAVLATPIVQLALQHGSFSPEATTQTAAALAVYALALPLLVFNKIGQSVLFAFGQTKTPLKAVAVALVVNVILNLLLYKPFGHVGIAAATVAATAVNSALLVVFLKQGQALPARLWQLVGQGALLVVVCFGLLLAFDGFFPQPEAWWPLAGWFMGQVVLVGAVVGVAFMALMKARRLP